LKEPAKNQQGTSGSFMKTSSSLRVDNIQNQPVYSAFSNTQNWPVFSFQFFFKYLELMVLKKTKGWHNTKNKLIQI
jgi:hypothetical protein